MLVWLCAHLTAGDRSDRAWLIELTGDACPGALLRGGDCASRGGRAPARWRALRTRRGVARIVSVCLRPVALLDLGIPSLGGIVSESVPGFGSKRAKVHPNQRKHFRATFGPKAAKAPLLQGCPKAAKASDTAIEAVEALHASSGRDFHPHQSNPVPQPPTHTTPAPLVGSRESSGSIRMQNKPRAPSASRVARLPRR